MKKCKINKFFAKNENKILQSEVIRCYECECGNEYADIVNKTDKPSDQFCDCGLKLEPVIMGPSLGFVQRGVTTVGKLAEENTRKQGKYRISAQREVEKEAIKAKRKRWYNPKGEDLSHIAKMSPERQKKYILEGK